MPSFDSLFNQAIARRELAQREFFTPGSFSVLPNWHKARQPPPKPEPVVEASARAYSFEEAQIVARCFRIMLPNFTIRVVETLYLSEYRIWAEFKS